MGNTESNNDSQINNGNLLKHQFRFFEFVGVLPSENVERSFLKSALYNTYSFVIFVIQIPAAVLLSVTIVDHWGDIDLISDLLFLTACYVNQAFTSFYFMTSRKLLRQVLYSLETTLVSAMEKIATPSLQKKYIGKAARSANKLVLIVTLSISFIYVSWILFPLLSALIPVETGKIDRNDDSLNSAIFLMWVPQNFTEAPKLELVLAFKSFSIFFGVLIFATTIVIILVVCTYLTSYFKILSQCIEDIEDIYPDDRPNVENVELQEEICLNEEISNDGNRLKAIENNEHGGSKEETVSKNIKNLEATDSTVEIINKDVSNDEERYRYLEECTIFHQVLLDVSSDVDDLLNPALLMFFFITELTMCFSAFALAQGATDIFKIFVSVFNVSVWPLMMCWYGDNLTEASLSVRDAAYGCRWYNRSQNYKKHLQMIIIRAQKPVVLSVGKFYDVSLQTFAEIANVVYGYYSILKGQSETEE